MTMWIPDLDMNPDRAAPLYRRIARQLERDIRSGRLRPDERLPPQRELADRLGVTVGTVSRAYAEAQRGGWVRGEVGRGSYVQGASRADEGRLDIAGGSEVDLSVNVPVRAGSPDLGAALRRLARGDDLSRLLDYRASEGALDDRRAGAEFVARHGVDATPEQVVVCAGAQHGLAVAIDACLRSGDAIAAAELTAPGFRPLAEARGLRILPVRLDRYGLVPESFERACRAGARALYVVPTHQNPMGGTLSLRRRRALVRIAEAHDVLLIEDDIHRLLQPDSPPPLAALAPETSLYITSLSKCLAPGLRVGYVRAPARLHARVVGAVWSSLWSVSPLTSALATQWIRDGTLDAVVARKREEATARQALARAILQPERESGPPPGAYHLWLDLGARDALRFCADAAARGVRVTPADAFSVVGEARTSGVRIALGGAHDRATLRSGLEILAALLRDGSEPPRVRI